MQPNEIKVIGEVTMGSASLQTNHTVSQTYSRFSERENSTLYIDRDAHSADHRNQLSLARVLPKRNGNFRGVTKSTFKFTKDVEVPSASSADAPIVQPLIATVELSVPVGTSEADLIEMLARLCVVLPRVNDDVNVTPTPSELYSSFVVDLAALGEI